MRPTLALTILTGASRGLGAAIAEQLLQRGATLLTMSRHPDPTLNAKAAETGASLAFLARLDLVPILSPTYATPEPNERT